MNDSRRKHILITSLGLLGALLVLDRVLWPALNAALTATDARIMELRRKLADAPPDDDVETDRTLARIAAAQAHFALSMPRRQQYLESRIGQRFIRSAVPGRPADLAAWPGKQVVSFQLNLRSMTLEELAQTLASLDADPQPMRVDHLRILPVNDVERMLQVELTVTTLTEAAGGASSAAAQPATVPPVQTVDIQPPPLRPWEKNIFFPELMLTRPLPDRPDLVVRPFTVVGIEGAGEAGRVLLRLRDPEETRWVNVSTSVDGVELVEVDPSHATFSVGGTAGRLTVGQSSGRLLLGKRTFRSHAVIAATITTPDGPLAAARFPGRSDYVYLAVGDVLPSGRIVAVGDDSITVEYAGYEEVIPIGRTSDTPIPPLPPWTMTE